MAISRASPAATVGTTLRIHISDAMQPGQEFATFHTPTSFVAHLTSSHRDRVGTPKYKVTSVRIERLAAAEAKSRSHRAVDALWGEV